MSLFICILFLHYIHLFECVSQYTSKGAFNLNGAQNLIVNSYFLMQNNIRVVNCLIMQ